MDGRKKEAERFIVTRFKKQCEIPFQILDADAARTVYGDYTEENPDFIIRVQNGYIGIELAQLCLNKSPQLSGEQDHRGRQIKNLAHLSSKRCKMFKNLTEFEEALKNPDNFRLIPQDDIEQVLLKRIQDKIKKLSQYVTPKIWLLLYAKESYQTKIVESILNDRVEDSLRKSVNGMNISDRIDKIYLFETATSATDSIIRLK